MLEQCNFYGNFLERFILKKVEQSLKQTGKKNSEKLLVVVCIKSKRSPPRISVLEIGNDSSSILLNEDHQEEET